MTNQQKLQLAAEHHRNGRLAQAEPLYREILAQQPRQPDALHLLGVLANQTRHHREACELIRLAIAVHPVAEFYFDLAAALMPLNESDQAIEALQKAIALKPNWAGPHANLGNLLQGKKQFDAAIAEMQCAVSLESGNPELHYNLGNALMDAQRHSQAVDAFGVTLKIKPDHANALNNLSGALQSLGRFEEAEKAVRQALHYRPQFPEALNNLASILFSLNQFDPAIASLREAIRLQPTMPVLYNRLGNMLSRLARYEQAIEAYRQGMRLNPNWPAIHSNLSGMLLTMGDLDGAIAEARIALQLEPGSFLARQHLAEAMRNKGELDSAIDLLAELAAEQPGDEHAHNNYGNALWQAGRVAESLKAYQRGAEANPAIHFAASNYLFALQFHTDDPGEILAANQDWNRRYAERFQAEALPHDNDRDPNRRLRIGYLSPDFRIHCQALFTSALLPNHDHQQFEIFCYSTVLCPDAISARLQQQVDVWRSVAPLPDQALAEMIRADGIDILVDLTMHMGHARPLVFARKPTPVQVAWLAYPGTTGIWAMDYRLTDPHLDPANFDDRYSEKSIRLRNAFWCYDPYGLQVGRSAQLPEPNDLPSIKNGFVTFGCLNEFAKLNSGTLRRWAQLMRSVSNSRIHLLAPRSRYRNAVLEQFKEHGISPDRVEFIDRKPRPTYLAEYHRIDLCLDTLPYNGHTTSLDAFWMGVPVLTQIGRTVVGRAGFSQLVNLQLKDFAAEEDARFIELGIRWATDLASLAEIRRTLRDRMAASPLMNGKQFAGDMETAFRQMWHEWIQG